MDWLLDSPLDRAIGYLTDLLGLSVQPSIIVTSLPRAIHHPYIHPPTHPPTHPSIHPSVFKDQSIHFCWRSAQAPSSYRRRVAIAASIHETVHCRLFSSRKRSADNRLLYHSTRNLEKRHKPKHHCVQYKLSLFGMQSGKEAVGVEGGGGVGREKPGEGRK